MLLDTTIDRLFSSHFVKIMNVFLSARLRAHFMKKKLLTDMSKIYSEGENYANKNISKTVVNGNYECYIELDASRRVFDLSSCEIPALAVGTALIDPQKVGSVVTLAVELGYRHLDTAAIYGNEKQVGQALAGMIDNGIVKRSDLFISSKLWSTFHCTDLAVQACEDTLRRLNLDYLDLMMVHNPMSFLEGELGVPIKDGEVQYSHHDYMDAWRGLEEAKRLGLVRHIGVSNFNSQQIKRVLDEGVIQPIVNQVECHPYLAQTNLSAFCRASGVALSCYGTLGSAGTPKEYLAPGRAILEDTLVHHLADKYRKTAPQILLRYQLERKHLVVVKTTSEERLRENLDIFDFSLSTEEVDKLNALDNGERHFNFKGMGDTHPNYPFNIEY